MDKAEVYKIMQDVENVDRDYAPLPSPTTDLTMTEG